MSHESQEFVKPTRFKLGIALCFAAGLFPFLVGCYQFVMFLVSLANPTQPWRASGFAPVCFSLEDVEGSCAGIACCPDSPCDVATQFVLAQHIEFANVINTGLMVMLLVYFALRRTQTWSWWTLLISYLWVGLNDTIALLDAGQIPVPLLGVIIGVTGLALTRPYVFKTPV